MVDQAIANLAAITSRMAKVAYPTWRQDAAAHDNLSALFASRLNALRAPGDDAPAVIDVADAEEAAARLQEIVGVTPEGEIVRQGQPRNQVPLRDYRIGITHADFLIAATGSVIIALPDAASAYASLLVDRHIVLASHDQLLPDICEFYSRLSEKVAKGEALPNYVCITGCSRTADIEKMLVVPAHGPRQVRVLLSARSISDAK